MSLPATRVVTVEGSSVEIAVAGEGTPIVLVNGAGGPIEGWMRIFDQLAGLGTVVGYNRPGLGRSARPAVAQTGAVMVKTLRQLLAVVELSPPYLLVGHSLGGLVVDLFARTRPGEVAGVVFLDSSTAEDVAAMPRFETGFQRLLKRIGRAISTPDPLSETEQVAETVAQLAEAGPFPAVPVTVVSGGRPAMAWATPAEALAVRAAHQKLLVGRSPKGKHVIAARSGHFPQLTEPKLVIDAIRSTLDATRPNPSDP